MANDIIEPTPSEQIEQEPFKVTTMEDLIRDIQQDDPTFQPDTNIYKLRPDPDISQLIPLTFDQLAQDVPKPLEHVLYPCLPTQGIGWVYAATGLGKTLFTLNLAYAIAGGGNFLKYSCPKPRRVLYVDGEMAYSQLHSRIMQISSVQGELYSNEHFMVLTPDKVYPMRVPHIDTEMGQEVYVKLIEKYNIEVIIFDNLSMLSSFDENKSSEWKPIQDWLLYLRSMGKTIIVVHHSGKSGDYRGTSRMLDCADMAVALEPVNHDKLESEDPLIKQFKISYKKARIFGGKEALPLEVSLDNGFWSYKSMEQTEMDKVVEMSSLGLSQRDMARDSGISQSKICRLLKRAKALKLIKD
jgi:RecA-family ATPase